MEKCGRRLDIVKHKSRKRIDIKVDKPDIEQEGKGKVHFAPRQFTLSIYYFVPYAINSSHFQSSINVPLAVRFH